MARSLCVLVSLIIILSFNAVAQTANIDTLSIHDGFWGLSYQKGSQKISAKDFEQLLKSNPDQSIYELYSSGSTQSTIAQVFAFGGGFCLGYGLTTKPTNTALAVTGGVIAIASFVLDNSGRNKINEAVSKYNASLQGQQSLLPLQYFTPNTIFALSISL